MNLPALKLQTLRRGILSVPSTNSIKADEGGAIFHTAFGTRGIIVAPPYFQPRYAGLPVPPQPAALFNQRLPRDAGVDWAAVLAGRYSCLRVALLVFTSSGTRVYE
jgi:hypothetical protein